MPNISCYILQIFVKDYSFTQVYFEDKRLTSLWFSMTGAKPTRRKD